MSRDIFRKLRLSDRSKVTVLYHYEDRMPIIDHVWDEAMEYDVDVSSEEGERLTGIIVASYMEEDLRLMPNQCL